MLVCPEVVATPRMDVPPPEPLTPEEVQARRAQLNTDMAAWLPRMVGRFSFDGIVQHYQTLALGATAIKEFSPDKTYAAGTCDESCQASISNVAQARGKADCIAIGTGPGVQCVINVVWPEEWGSLGGAVEAGVSFLGPAAILYGLDPNAALVRYLMLNTNGTGEAEAGVLKGDTVTWTFNTRCESSSIDRCRRITRFRAPPGDKSARTTSIDIEKWDARNGTWQRLSSLVMDMHLVPAGAPGAAPKAAPLQRQPAMKPGRTPNTGAPGSR